MHQKKSLGFSLSEVLATVAITGLLSSVAIPSFKGNIDRSRQNEAVSSVSQIQTTIAAYADEYGSLPSQWSELNKISAVITNDGPAEDNNFEPITLLGGFYDVTITNDGNLFTITATPNDNSNLNVIACLDLANGASGMNKGTKDEETTTPNCG
ncbi:pilin polypeptide PilA-like N-terminal methylation domain-containing protein [Synechococcus sp. NOUM97013]|nr:pilin polypeptide PilA-like N-terminal methylation domain-containing protein [Synechococcus sp. NOUM97013]